jgi:hypothetical protein
MDSGRLGLSFQASSTLGGDVAEELGGGEGDCQYWSASALVSCGSGGDMVVRTKASKRDLLSFINATGVCSKAQAVR